jgi:hypothetical protein
VRGLPPADERSQLQLLEQTVTDRLTRVSARVVNVERRPIGRAAIALSGLFAWRLF